MQKSIVLKADSTKRNNNDIVIFKEIYIEILASKKSKFSILVKPRDKFKQIKLMETEIVQPLKDKDLFLYLEIDNKKKQELTSLLLELETVKTYNKNIQYLFNSDSDVSLNHDSPFIAMPIADQTQSELEFKTHTKIWP